MGLFIYFTDEANGGRYTALEVEPVEKFTAKPPYTKDGYNENSAYVRSLTRFFEVNVPIAALNRFTDRVITTYRQLKPLDLSENGQKNMTNAYNKGKFDEFLKEHTM